LARTKVLHQVRTTYAARRASQPLDPALGRLFQVALNAGRRAHGWFGGSKRSLGDAALDEIERRTGTLVNQPILIVGAGSMGRLTAQAAVRRGARVIITSRTAERAASLAHDVEGQALDYAVDGTIPPVVGAIVALSGPWQIGALDAQGLVNGRNDRCRPLVAAGPLGCSADRLRRALRLHRRPRLGTAGRAAWCSSQPP